MAIETTPALVQRAYDRATANLEIVRERLGRPLTYAEKVLLGHLALQQCRAEVDMVSHRLVPIPYIRV